MILILEIAVGVALGLLIFHRWQSVVGLLISVLGLLIMCLFMGGIVAGGYWVWKQNQDAFWGILIAVVGLIYVKSWASKPAAQRTGPGIFHTGCRRVGRAVAKILSLTRRGSPVR
jgi:hypothetical protein